MSKLIFTPEELQTGRLDCFEQIPQGTRKSGAAFPRNYPEQDFDAICLHRPELMWGEKRTARFFRKMASPYHAWLCGPDATRQTYSVKVAGSRQRDPNAQLKPGYSRAWQRVAFNICGWALKNDNGGTPIEAEDGKTRKMQTNRRGRLLQITLGGWSADSAFTSETDYKFYAYYIARAAAWLRLTNPNRTEFNFDPWQDVGNWGVWKMADAVWMSPTSKRLMDHGAVPSGNVHWDCGPLNFRHLADLCKAEYDKLFAEGPKVSVTYATTAGTATGVTMDGSQVSTDLSAAAKGEPDHIKAAQSFLGKAGYELQQYQQKKEKANENN